LMTIGLVSCGTKSSEPVADDPKEIDKAIAACKPQSDAMRATLAQVASGLPKPGPDIAAPKPLDPQPVYLELGVDAPEATKPNTGWLQQENLLDITAMPKLDLEMRDSLVIALQRTAPGSAFSGAASAITKACTDGLAMRYLIVVRTDALELPKL